MKYFMLDIETMGIDFDQHDIIQIGLLELNKTGRYYEPGRSYVQVLHTDQQSTDPWILKTHAKLLPRSQAAEYEAPTVTRAKILNFVRNCGVDDKIMVMGLNAGTFDIPFCVKKGLLKKEDYHYRIFELTGAYNLAQDILNLNRRDELFKVANEACPWITPEGEAHDALYDCYSQLKTLNGIINLTRK